MSGLINSAIICYVSASRAVLKLKHAPGSLRYSSTRNPPLLVTNPSHFPESIPRPLLTARVPSSLKVLWAIVCVVVSLGGAASTVFAKSVRATPKTQVFRGAWFEVRAPATFVVKPSLKSSTADGYDSVEFVAPDGAVSFYVFAPQWGGEATDIALNAAHEQIVTERRKTEGNRELRWFTIAARDGSYKRSYLETLAQQGSVRQIVGIKYRNDAARRQYQQAYERFRRSLRVFAD